LISAKWKRRLEKEGKRIRIENVHREKRQWHLQLLKGGKRGGPCRKKSVPDATTGRKNPSFDASTRKREMVA